LYNIEYKKYISNNEEIELLESKLKNKDLKMEQLQHEINEIDDAELNDAEEESLLQEIKRLSNMKEIMNLLFEANNLLNQNDDSALNILNNVYSLLNKTKSYDSGLESFLSRLELLLDELQYFNYDLSDYTDNLNIDEERLIFLESRVSLINRLKRKYGFNIDKIFEYRESAGEELKVLKEAEHNLKSMHEKKVVIYKKLSDLSNKITRIRTKTGKFLESAILKELHDLNMKNIEFKVNIGKKDEYSQDGLDDVEFLISTNLGSNLNSVQKVVSGGEASRIMLAFKKISSDIDRTHTLIFDEIDSGISGKTAQMAGLKMNFISSNHQIICVTHSPQIASISKDHFLIEKKVVENNTYSSIKKLDEEERVYEIARLLSGLKITEKSISNAHELIDFSNKV
jgi:DNA repair protein RecN (Recombination protein N)